MRWLALLYGLLVLAGCSSSSSSETGSCKYANQCPTAACKCNDGKAAPGGSGCIGGSCLSVDSWCNSGCKDHGGVASAGVAPNIEGSTECNAWCDRWSKDCGGPCAIEACNVEFCDAAQRAALQCAAAAGITNCQSFSIIPDACNSVKYVSMCSDAGTTDAASDGG